MWIPVGPLTISDTNLILGLHWDQEKRTGKEWYVERFSQIKMFLYTYHIVSVAEKVNYTLDLLFSLTYYYIISVTTTVPINTLGYRNYSISKPIN